MNKKIKSETRTIILGVPFDLSKVMFITTANLLDPIQPAFRDRMEIIQLPGYIEEEKLEIAQQHLVPKQVKENALTPRLIQFTCGAIKTGSLGEVMKESAHAALSYARAHAKELGIDNKIFSQNDFHIHIPEGAIPKDGPSAGITMATALISVCTNRKIRWDVAMTGEITLRGNVLPIGGVKEKVLAAQRAGIKKMILPAPNKKDLIDIPKIVAKDMDFIFVEDINQVFAQALKKK